MSYRGDKFPESNQALVVDSMFSFGNHSVTAESSRIVGVDKYETAKSEYSVPSVMARANVGCEFGLGNGFSITPKLGVNYTRTFATTFKETGTTIQNQEIYLASSNVVEGVFGVDINAGTFDMGSVSVSPRFNGSVAYDFFAKKELDKSDRTSWRFAGSTEYSPINNVQGDPLSFNLGAGLAFNTEMAEFGIFYDTTLQENRSSYQGSLNVRIEL